MKFTTLTIQNFLSIKSAKISLSNRGLVLIEGVNEDDPSAKSNGSGKSSIVDAISWCLYGKTARGVSTDDVINRQANKNCSVQIKCEDASWEYTIVRGRKTSMGNVLVVFQNDLDDGKSSKELTKGTMAETQTLIEEIIGCPYEVFIASVYCGQEAMPDLPSMTDKKLKALIEEVIGINKLQKAYEQVNEKYRKADEYLTLLERDQSALNDQFTMLGNMVEDYKRKQIEQQEENEIQKVRLLEAIKNCEKEAVQTEREKESDKLYVVDVNNRLGETIRRLADLSEKQTEMQNVRQKYDIANQKMLVSKVNAEHLASEARLKVEAFKKVGEKIGTTCSECGKTYTQEDIAPASALARTSAMTTVEEAKKAKTKYEQLVVECNAVKAELDSYQSLEKEIADLTKIQFKLESERASYAMKRYNDYSSHIESYKKTLESLKSDTYEDVIKDHTSRMVFVKQAIVDKQKEIEEAKNTLTVFAELKKVFGSAGVRAHILDTITPLLNDRTARYLDILSDGKLSAVWTTLSMTKKGELRENFNIAVKNTVGGGSFESLSGGEKRKVRVACCLALQEVVASRATKPIELFIADEVDHALDESGVERLIGVLTEKAETCGSLFVISHNPLRSWITNAIVVKKKDGFSEIVE